MRDDTFVLMRDIRFLREKCRLPVHPVRAALIRKGRELSHRVGSGGQSVFTVTRITTPSAGPTGWRFQNDLPGQSPSKATMPDAAARPGRARGAAERHACFFGDARAKS